MLLILGFGVWYSLVWSLTDSTPGFCAVRRVGLVVVGLSHAGGGRGLVVLECFDSVSSGKSLRTCPEFWVRRFVPLRRGFEDSSFVSDNGLSGKVINFLWN